MLKAASRQAFSDHAEVLAGPSAVHFSHTLGNGGAQRMRRDAWGLKLRTLCLERACLSVELVTETELLYIYIYIYTPIGSDNTRHRVGFIAALVEGLPLALQAMHAIVV